MQWVKKFYKNYKSWLFLFVTVTLVVLVSAWLKSDYSNRVLSGQQVQPKVENQFGPTLFAAYPRRVLYNSDELYTIDLWLVCQTNCFNNEFILSNDYLLFSSSQDLPRWLDEIHVTLATNGDPVRLWLTSKDDVLAGAQDTFIQIEPPNLSIPHQFPLKIEGRYAASLRLMLVEFLGQAGVIVSIIIAMFAWIREQEEEKRKQAVRLKHQQAIDSFPDFASNRPLGEFIESCLAWVADWEEWDGEQRGQFARLFSEFLETDYIMRLPRNTTMIRQLLERTTQIQQQVNPGDQHPTLQALTRIATYDNL